MSEKERRWGMLVVSKDFDAGLVQSYLPDGHRILASKSEPSASFDLHIIEGSDMPIVQKGKRPEHVDLLLYVDDSGVQYGYWSHKQERWLLPMRPLTA